MVMRGLRCVLAGRTALVMVTRRSLTIIINIQTTTKRDANDQRLSGRPARRAALFQRCRPRSALWLFLTCFRLPYVPLSVALYFFLSFSTSCFLAAILRVTTNQKKGIWYYPLGSQLRFTIEYNEIDIHYVSWVVNKDVHVYIEKHLYKLCILYINEHIYVKYIHIILF